ncbi:MAG: hypothetical protein HDQ99_12535 [Lachnospiraceae bacterium]|nr:hypothetical protein [Lachnospiraceae bacterium]
MGKEDFKIEGTVEKKLMVDQIRLAARQFAMLYFHFSKVLYENYGAEKAKDLVRQAVFEQALERSDIMREKAIAEQKGTDTVEDFMSVIDLPFCGWIPQWGEDHCPYAENWRGYLEKYPWFQEFATFYCDVIDTTTIENFTKHISHEITQNVITEGQSCERKYFESEAVKGGRFTYEGKA